MRVVIGVSETRDQRSLMRRAAGYADLIQRGDGSFGVHNPIYAEALLLGSTQAVRAQYTYLPPAPPAEAARMRARMQAGGMKP